MSRLHIIAGGKRERKMGMQKNRQRPHPPPSARIQISSKRVQFTPQVNRSCPDTRPLSYLFWRILPINREIFCMCETRCFSLSLSSPWFPRLRLRTTLSNSFLALLPANFSVLTSRLGRKMRHDTAIMYLPLKKYNMAGGREGHCLSPLPLSSGRIFLFPLLKVSP